MRRWTGVLAASTLVSGVTGSAWAVYPSFITFENDVDNYTPTQRDILNDPNLDGLPPTFPGPPNGQFLEDIRVQYSGAVEEVASNQFATVPAAASGNHLGLINFEGADGGYGRPMGGQPFPAPSGQWSFQTDVYTDPAIPFVSNGLPTFWWTNAINNNNPNWNTHANDAYLTEQGFQVYAGGAPGGTQTTGPTAQFWSFTVGGYFNPNDPDHDELGIIPVGQWVTMETVFDFNDPSGEIYAWQKLWSLDRTILYGAQRNIVYNSESHDAADAYGPRRIWFVYPNVGMDALFVDNVGIGPAITQATSNVTQWYWDTNGGVTGTGTTPSGDWDGVSAFFNSDPAGGSGTLDNSTTSLDIVSFSAGNDATGNYTVTVSGVQSAAQVKIEEGNATFSGGSISTPAIDVASGANATVNSSLFSNSGLVKSGGGNLTLTAANYLGDTNVTGGTLSSTTGFKAQGALTVADGAKAVVPESAPSSYDPGNNQFPSGLNTTGSIVNHITLNGSAQLDLNNNDMIVDHNGVSPLTDIRDMIASGYNFGGQDGRGIISSTAANTDPFTFALGYGENADLPLPYGTEFGGGPFAGLNPDATSVLIKFTWIGDVTLDGIFDFQDLSIFNGNYDAGATTGRVWTEGDLNYDGTIDFQDLSLFNGTYDPSKPSLPEPGALSLLGLAALGLGRRRRKA